MYLLQIVFGSMLIVAWVMSDPVNCELMGRPVMQKEMTYVCYSSSTGSHCLLPVGGRTTPPNQVRLALDLIAFCPWVEEQMIRYMVVVLARPIFGSHCLVEEQLIQIKFDWHWISLSFARRWKNNSSKSSSTGQWPTSASPTGSMLVVTDDLHPMGAYRTLFQLVPNLQLVQGKICLISSDLVGSKLY